MTGSRARSSMLSPPGGRPTFRTAGGAEFERQKFRRRWPGPEEAFVVPDPWPVPVQEQLVNA